MDPLIRSIPPSWKTTPRPLSATAYSIYSQLPSLSEAVPLSATWGRAHTTQSLREFLATKQITVLEHPSYSPDLTPDDFFLFPKIIIIIIIIINIKDWTLRSVPSPQAGGPPLVRCPRLLIQYIRSYPPYRRPFLYPQPEDAPCRGNKDPLHGAMLFKSLFFLTVWYSPCNSI